MANWDFQLLVQLDAQHFSFVITHKRCNEVWIAEQIHELLAAYRRPNIDGYKLDITLRSSNIDGEILHTYLSLLGILMGKSLK